MPSTADVVRLTIEHYERHLREHLTRRSPQDDWDDIESDYDHLDRVPDLIIHDQLARQLADFEFIADSKWLQVPPPIAARVLADVIKKLRRSAQTPEDRRAITEANRLLVRWRKTLPRRPNHRPRKTPGQLEGQEHAVRTFISLRAEMRAADLSGDDATKQAAELVGPYFGVMPQTLVTWSQRPGRRRTVQRLRRLRKRRLAK
jgi:hypothetical protein